MSRKRKKPNKELRKRLISFYGNECILCGSRDPVDYAHINDDASDTTFENLVPLCADANALLERSKYSFLTGEVEPIVVFEKARSHFRYGSFAKSSGCYSLAAQLFLVRKRFISHGFASLLGVISALRPLGDGILLKRAIQQAYRCCDNNFGDLPDIWKAEFLGLIGLVLDDYHRFAEATEFQLQAWSFYSRLIESAYPEDVAIKKAAGARRAARILGAETEAGEYFRTAKSCPPQKMQPVCLNAGVNGLCRISKCKRFSTFFGLLSAFS
jgi:hypothetical protein